MEYSFKKLLRNDYITYVVFTFLIVFLIIFIILSVIPILIINDIVTNNNGFDFNLIKKFEGFFIFYFVYFLGILINLIILLKRTHRIKHFQKNYSEITAKIEYYNSIKGRNLVDVAYYIMFSYNYNNENYSEKYKIRNNKHTKSYINNYLKYGKMVNILVRNDNPKRIAIKEIFE